METNERTGARVGPTRPALDAPGWRTQAAPAAAGLPDIVLDMVALVLRVLLSAGALAVAIGICATPAAQALLGVPPVTTQPATAVDESTPIQAAADAHARVDPVTLASAVASRAVGAELLTSSDGKASSQTWTRLQAAIAALDVALSTEQAALVGPAVDELTQANASVTESVTQWDAANATPVDSRTAEEVFTSYVTQVGGYDVSVAMDWVDQCDDPDKGADWIHGCVVMDGSGVIHMKDVPTDLASGSGGKYVALHEYAHVLQDRLGSDLVTSAGTALFGAGNEIEMSADCMAVLLGADPATYTPAYTADCTGGRSDFAAALIAGRVP